MDINSDDKTWTLEGRPVTRMISTTTPGWPPSRVQIEYVDEDNNTMLDRQTGIVTVRSGGVDICRFEWNDDARKA